MATRKRAEPKAAKAAPATTEAAKDEAAKNDAADKTIEAAQFKSPIAGTGPVPVFRTDMGESLPPQKKAGVV